MISSSRFELRGIDFRGPAAVLVVRHEHEHERWVDILANAGECLPLLLVFPSHNTNITPNISTHLCLERLLLDFSYLVR